MTRRTLRFAPPAARGGSKRSPHTNPTLLTAQSEAAWEGAATNRGSGRHRMTRVQYDPRRPPATCESCQRVYRVKHGGRGRFCSRRCHLASRTQSALRAVVCDACGVTVERFEYQIRKPYLRRFCSYRCAHPDVVHDCKHCGTPVSSRPHEGKRFCNPECYLRWLHAQKVSQLERDVVADLTAHGLSCEVQVPLCGFHIDIAFRDAMVAVEVDGDYWHSLPRAVARDRAVDRRLAAAGWTLIRLAESDLNSTRRASMLGLVVDAVEERTLCHV